MKPNELAKLLNVPTSTLRRWAGKEYADFLSPSGVGNNGAQRSFTDQDARILSWIALMRAQNQPPAEIVAQLRAARETNWQTLPPFQGMEDNVAVALIPREALAEQVKALADKYDLVIKERDDLRGQLEAARRESGETIKQLNLRITELTAQASELRGLMQQYTFGGRRINAALLVLAALLLGIIITLVMVALLSRR